MIGGAAPAFEVSARGTSEILGERATRNIGRLIAPFDLGLIGALGLELGRAHVEGRYTHGLLRINTDNNDRLNNRVFSVTIGFRFR